MHPTNNLDNLISLFNQIENLDLSKDTAIDYDKKTNTVKGYHSNWIFSYFRKRSENAHTANAVRQFTKMFDNAMQEVKEGLQNPRLSKQQREDLVAKAEFIQIKLNETPIKNEKEQWASVNKTLSTLREIAEKRDNREVALAINTLIYKINGVKETFENSLDITDKINSTLESFKDVLSLPADKVVYNKETEKFSLSEKRVSPSDTKAHIEQSLEKLRSNLDIVQQYIVEDLSPFKNLNIAERASPQTILKEIERQKSDLILNDEDLPKISESIKEYKYEIKRMAAHLIKAAEGFNHLVSKLSEDDQAAYKSMFILQANRLINRDAWIEILNKFEAAIKFTPQQAYEDTPVSEQDALSLLDDLTFEPNTADENLARQELDDILFAPLETQILTDEKRENQETPLTNTPRANEDDSLNLFEQLNDEELRAWIEENQNLDKAPSLQKLRDLRTNTENKQSEEFERNEELEKLLKDFKINFDDEESESSDKPSKL